jgi:ArsR family transcriptional regulator
MEETPLDQLIRIHKALAHPVRVRILAMLRGGELCVCQLNAVIGLAPSTISAHLAELKDAGMIGERKEGRWVHYRLVAAEVRKDALATLWPTLAADQLIADDATLLKAITKLPVKAICRPEFDVSTLRATCCRPATKKRTARA